MNQQQQKKRKRRQQKLTGQKVLEAQRDEPIPVLIILLENIRHPLQRNAALNKHVEAHTLVPALVVDPVHHAHKVWAEVVSKGDQRLAELVVGYAAGAIDIEAPEERAPGGEEGPEAAVGWKISGCWARERKGASRIGNSKG